MPLRVASSPTDSFRYPADSQEESHSQDAHGEEEEEFLYPGIGDSDVETALGALPVPSPDTITSTPSPSGSQAAVPLDSSELTEYPSSNETLRETSPPRPDRNPNPSLPAQPHASPAQLEALYAAASSGDLPLLQRTINHSVNNASVSNYLVDNASVDYSVDSTLVDRYSVDNASVSNYLVNNYSVNNALQTGNLESFSLVNGASSRTGLTALHAAASRGYIDIVKWCKAALSPSSRAF